MTNQRMLLLSIACVAFFSLGSPPRGLAITTIADLPNAVSVANLTECNSQLALGKTCSFAAVPFSVIAVDNQFSGHPLIGSTFAEIAVGVRPSDVVQNPLPGSTTPPPLHLDILYQISNIDPENVGIASVRKFEVDTSGVQLPAEILGVGLPCPTGEFCGTGDHSPIEVEINTFGRFEAEFAFSPFVPTSGVLTPGTTSDIIKLETTAGLTGDAGVLIGDSVADEGITGFNFITGPGQTLFVGKIQPQPVPEPTLVTLMGSGLLALGFGSGLLRRKMRGQ